MLESRTRNTVLEAWEGHRLLLWGPNNLLAPRRVHEVPPARLRSPKNTLWIPVHPAEVTVMLPVTYKGPTLGFHRSVELDAKPHDPRIAG